MKTFKISVTSDHIKNGIRCECGKCPVALALKEQTGQDWAVLTRAIYCDIDDGKMFKEVLLPEHVGEFIDNFDAGRYVSPIEFEIEA